MNHENNPNPSHAVLVEEIARLRTIVEKLTLAGSGVVPYMMDHIAMTSDQGPGDRIALDRLDDALALARNYQAETWAQSVRDDLPKLVDECRPKETEP